MDSGIKGVDVRKVANLTLEMVQTGIMTAVVCFY